MYNENDERFPQCFPKSKILNLRSSKATFKRKQLLSEFVYLLDLYAAHLILKSDLGSF